MPRWSDFHQSGQLGVFIREYVVTAIFIILILVGVSLTMSSDFNVVAATIQIFGIALISAALVSPRVGMYLLILGAGYLDLIKRLMVVTGQVAINDVAWVLGVAPAIFSAVILGILVHRIFRHRIVERGEGMLILFIAILMGVNGYLAYRNRTSMNQALQESANTAGYIPLLLLTGVLFPSLEKLTGFLRYVCLIFLPIPLYALWQYFFGYAGFEYDYIHTGLSMTEVYLDDLKPRPFSTLASAHPLTIVCAMLFIISLIPVRVDRSKWFPFTNGGWMAISFLYLLGSFSSLARTGWLAAAVGLVAVFCFRKPKLTKAFYAFTLFCFFLMLLNPDWIEDHLSSMQAMLPGGSDAADMAFRLSTIGDRLHGWRNIISHPLAFRAFGVPLEERTDEVYVHDQIGGILLSSGYVGLICVVTLVTYAIVRAHRLVWKIRDPEAKNLAVVCLSADFSILVSGALFGSSTRVFPVNILFWLLIGVIMRIVRMNRQELNETAKSPEEQEKLHAPHAVGAYGGRWQGEPAWQGRLGGGK